MATKKQQREKRNKIIIGLIITVFMVSSIAGIVLYRTDNAPIAAGRTSLNLSGKQYMFEQKADQYGNYYYSVSGVSGSAFSVYFLPQQLTTLPLTQEMKSLIMESGYYYLSFDPESENVDYIDFLRFEFRNNFPSDAYFADTVTSESSIYNLPVATCLNATSQAPVVLIGLTPNSTNASLEDNCIKLNFAQYDLFRVRDAFIYMSHDIEIR